MRSWNGRTDKMLNEPRRDVLAGLFRCAAVLAMIVPAVGAATTVEEDMLWTGSLQQAYFGDRPIMQSDDVVVLEAPDRAEDAAIVPISITSKFAQSEDHYIKTIYVFIDKNPGPLTGTFHFTPASGRADLAFRVRVNTYSPIRVIAETNSGDLHMSRRFVKATGGCSAPAGADIDAAMARLGKLKLRTSGVEHPAEPVGVQLMISHPNLSGMQMDQVTRMFAPAHFVRRIKVSFDGEDIFSAETSFGISENPNFRFFFVPEHEGELSAEVLDTNDLTFSQTLRVAPYGAPEVVRN